MPAAKLSTSGSLNAMNSAEGNDSLDIFIREATGNEHFLPFSRKFDNQVQWIQLVNAIDQPGLVGWPVNTPVKAQLQKCEKCSLEFCSPINYRRHIRVHRRSLNVDKESYKKRDLLGAFWDKLSVEEAKEILLFNGVMLKEIPGASVVRGLASSLNKPGVWTLPQVYVRAGSSLVGIIQAKPSRLPISSQELFGILDEASERTFLCAGSAGTAESVQKYLFDGEIATIILELKNLVASIAFLFEQQLVKAWVADKDAQALRCQKLLVEEEEAAKKRLAEISERKKQKKIRQKELKLKEQNHQCKGDFNVVNEFDATDTPVLAEASGPPSSSDSSSNSKDGSANVDNCLESQQFQLKKSEEDIEAQIDFSNDCTIEEYGQTIAPPIVGEQHGPQHLAITGQQVSNSQRDCSSDCTIEEDNQTIGSPIVGEQHGHQLLATSGQQVSNSQRHRNSDFTVEEDNQTIAPPIVGEQHGPQHLATTGQQVSNSQRDCSSDCTIEEDNETIGSLIVGEQHGHQHLATSGQQVSNSQRHRNSDCTIEEDNQTIGSLHRHLATSGMQVSNSQRQSQKIHNSKPESTQKDSLSKNDEIDSNEECLKASLQGGVCCKTEGNSCEVMIGSISILVNGGAAVTPGGTKGISAVERGDVEDCEGGVILKKVGDHIVPGDWIEGVVPFASIVATAKEFMARRWKEAISGDHVKLDLSSAS